MGNDDSGCTDYALEPANDEFLRLTAKTVAEALPGDLAQAERAAVLRDFSAGGYYNVPLAGVPGTRLIVLDDVFLSASYTTCSGKPDPSPGVAELAWLQHQLDAARQQHERVWVLGHIPPGVNFYASARRMLNACGSGKPQMFLGSERLAEILAANADIVRLALFGHTHSDEIHLLTGEINPADSAHPASEIRDAKRTGPGGVPLKVVASITPVNGNRPTFTLATIDPASAELVDYTVIMASNLTGAAATWSPEYTYSTAYGEKVFDGAALGGLISKFQADPGAKSAASQAYLRNYFPGDASSVIKFAWPQYACSMNHDSASSFAACSCAASK
jgi:sphingomyelin phosphodiesterase acid-like 3